MSGHVEFPELSPEARAALEAFYKAAFPWHDGYKDEWTESHRKGQNAFLLEVMKQACEATRAGICCQWEALQFIAENLHSPPPPPPTLAQAREADMGTPEGRATVCAFLATLVEWVQP